MTGLGSEANRRPCTRGVSRECRSAPPRHEIYGTGPFNCQISPTNRGDRHAMPRPEAKWTSTAGSATVFGQREMLSGESRIQGTQHREGSDGQWRYLGNRETKSMAKLLIAIILVGSLCACAGNRGADSSAAQDRQAHGASSDQGQSRPSVLTTGPRSRRPRRND
jgi:hypothetical protein